MCYVVCLDMRVLMAVGGAKGEQRGPVWREHAAEAHGHRKQGSVAAMPGGARAKGGGTDRNDVRSRRCPAAPRHPSNTTQHTLPPRTPTNVAAVSSGCLRNVMMRLSAGSSPLMFLAFYGESTHQQPSRRIPLLSRPNSHVYSL